jgi:hypothetical protein
MSGVEECENMWTPGSEPSQFRPGGSSRLAGIRPLRRIGAAQIGGDVVRGQVGEPSFERLPAFYEVGGLLPVFLAVGLVAGVNGGDGCCLTAA